MKLLRWITSPFQRKVSATVRVLNAAGQYQFAWSNDDLLKIAKEAYEGNATVFAAVNGIAAAAAAVPWYLKRKDGKKAPKSEDHPLIQLLQRPNPTMGQGQFLRAVTCYLLIEGNAYIERTAGRVELWPLRPDRVKVKPGTGSMLVSGYEYAVNSDSVSFKAEDVLHLKLFSATNDYYGKSPLMVAARLIDTDNEVIRWNYNLLRNNARPPGVLETEGVLNDEEFLRLKTEIGKEWTGANALGPKLLEKGLTWKPTGLSPTDIDWIAGSKLYARKICTVLNYPPILCGDSENMTYSNYQEARKALYEETVLPYLDYLRDELNNWITPSFDERQEGLLLAYDADSIPALQENRAVSFSRVQTADWLSINEQREATGYDKITEEEADVPRALLAQRMFAPVPTETPTDEPVDGETEDTTEPETEDEGDVPSDGTAQDDVEDYPVDEATKRLRAYQTKAAAAAVETTKRQRLAFAQHFRVKVRDVFRAERSAIVGALRSEPPATMIAKMKSLVKAQEPGMKAMLGGMYSLVGRYFFSKTRENLGFKGARPGEKKDTNWTPILKKALKDMRIHFNMQSERQAENIGTTTVDTLQRTIKEGIFSGDSTESIVDKIMQVYDDRFLENRATTITENEISQVGNYGSDKGAKSTGLDLKKYWITMRDSRVRTGVFDHVSADMQAKNLDDPFVVSGEQLDFPGDESRGASSGNVINCRCMLTYEPQ
jgi:HK97 family phage portal protein